MYIVTGMKLIPQTMTMSCWYASAQMVITWRRNKSQSSEIGILDPQEDSESAKLKDDNNGIANPQIVRMARRLGLEPIPPVCPSEDGLQGWLRNYGPLWVNGISHIVVIAGIRPGQVLVYDPGPVNQGGVDWRSLSEWYIGDDVDLRDTSDDVETVFLHCPG